MTDGWEQRRTAQEEEYFQRQNKAALERLAARKAAAPRLCPVDGATLVSETLSGVVIDRCPTCKGVWLDGGELEQLLKDASQEQKGFLKSLFG